MVWAWVTLQVAGALIGAIFSFSHIIQTILSIVLLIAFLIFFLRASRWTWWLGIVVSICAVAGYLAFGSWWSIVWGYSLAFWTASTIVLLMPSVRLHFFPPRIRS